MRLRCYPTVTHWPRVQRATRRRNYAGPPWMTGAQHIWGSHDESTSQCNTSISQGENLESNGWKLLRECWLADCRERPLASMDPRGRSRFSGKPMAGDTWQRRCSGTSATVWPVLDHQHALPSHDEPRDDRRASRHRAPPNPHSHLCWCWSGTNRCVYRTRAAGVLSLSADTHLVNDKLRRPGPRSRSLHPGFQHFAGLQSQGGLE